MQQYDWLAAERLCEEHRSDREGRAWNAYWGTHVAYNKADESGRRSWGDRLIAAVREMQKPPRKLLYAAAIQIHLQDRMSDALELLAAIPIGEDGSADVLRRRVNYALKLRSRLDRADPQVGILSVGQACMGHNIAIRCGLSDRVIDGPFAAGVFRAPSVALDENFEKLLSPGAYVYAKTLNSLKTITIPAYKAILNHEIGPFWLSNGAERVTSLYRQRVANLKAIVARPTLLILEQRAPINVDELLRSLDKHFTNRIRMLILHTYGESPASTDPRVRVLKAKLDASVQWWLPEVYNSPAGEAYERPIADAIMEEIENLAA